MGMIANMILNFPVFQYQFLAFLLLEYTVINDILGSREKLGGSELNVLSSRV